MTHSIYDPGVFGQACLKQPPDSALSSHSWTRQLHRAACFHPPVYPVIAAVLLGHDTRHVKSELHIMIHNANLKKYEHWIQPEWNDAMQVSESVQITNYLYNPISWSIPIRHEYFKSFVCKHNQKRIRLYIIRGEYGSATSMHHLVLLHFQKSKSSIMCMQCNVLPTSDLHYSVHKLHSDGRPHTKGFWSDIWYDYHDFVKAGFGRSNVKRRTH